MNQLVELKQIRQTWDKYTEGWLGSIIYLILGFIIAFVLNMGLGFALNTTTPVVAVFSESMEPTYYKGDMIIVQGEKNFSVGDIIVFDVSDKKFPIIHRVIKINADGTLETKGDNNSMQLTFEHNIDSSKVHGKAVFKIPLLGWVKILFTEVTGLG